MLKRIFAVALVALLPMVAVAQANGFPHAKHVKLFPTCTGCHAGVPAGERATTFPATAQCEACHNGTDQKVVAWKGRQSAGAGLVRFSHPAHAIKSTAGGEKALCESCHARTPGSTWMDVSKAVQDRCNACHTHQVTQHFADENNCSTCHRPLTEATAWTDARIAALPKPASHSRSDFIAAHKPGNAKAAATCQTCHAKESCQRCHANAGRIDVVKGLKADARIARLVANKAPVYPLPDDHQRNGFDESHGKAALANAGRCANCHAQSSCATCHTGEGARKSIAMLPDAKEANGRGVKLARPVEQSAPVHTIIPAALNVKAPVWTPAPHADSTKRTVRVHPNTWNRTHGSAASADPTSCAGCHAQRYCTDCHAGERNTRRYHQANFVSRHGTGAYSRDTECSTCHSAEVFCRSCHNAVGVGTGKGGIKGVGYHNGKADWRFQHGRAARQELSNCVTCHQQRDCQQCHSQLGWRINPHGADFDAERMGKANKAMCLKCHFKDPLAGK